MDLTAPATQADLALLNDKIDRLTALMEDQQRRAQMMEDLRDDMLPIVNHMVKISIDELAEIGSEFQLEDLLYLLKRLLRDTHMLVDTLNSLEALHGLKDEAQLMGQQVFNQVIEQLEALEQAGYFAFARGGMYVAERVVAEFNEQDVRDLGDNIVLILNTVKDMTQPEVMHFVRSTLLLAEKEIEKPVDTSLRSLLGQMRDPQVRRGLALTMRVLKAVGSQAGTNGASSMDAPQFSAPVDGARN